MSMYIDTTLLQTAELLHVTFWLKAHSFMVLLTGSTCAVISMYNFSVTESLFFITRKTGDKINKERKSAYLHFLLYHHFKKASHSS